MKVLKSDIEKRITHVSYHHAPGTTTTTAYIKLDNGYVSTGDSSAVDPALFNAQIGKTAAFEEAFRKLYAPLAFLLLEAKFQDAKAKTFGGALKALKAGKRVKRAGHVDQMYLDAAGNLRVDYLGGSSVGDGVNTANLLAEDWEVVK